MYVKPRKRFGQHFLKDTKCLDKIIDALAAHSTDCFVEIGPGLGALTEKLLTLGTPLSAIEIDKDLIELLKQRWPETKQFKLYSADALSFDFSEIAKQHNCLLRIVGNLPYNISTPLLFHLMHFIDHIQDLHLMLQKEVVDRLAAPVGSAHYGRLSIMMQYYCQVQRLFIIRPGAFWPVPKVDSAVVRLTPWKPQPILADNVELFAEVVRRAFSQRRKTLRNSLSSLVRREQFTHCQIDPQCRPDQISVSDYVRLANRLFLSVPHALPNNEFREKTQVL